MIDSISKKRCTGCKMCADVCPKGAISFDTDRQGFWFPVVDHDKCVRCSACINYCIVNKEISVETHRKAYAAWSRNDKIRRQSTSGGVYYELANAILAENGYLVGSVYTDDYCGAYHIISNDPSDLNKLLGSKYFQSDTEQIFKKTKAVLDAGHKVLFTGTPCQVHALKAFLKKDYENLLTLDFICRGVPSPLLQKKKIEFYEQKWHSKVETYRDKSKHVGWANFGEYITFKNGKKVFISRWEDHINNCFIEKNLNIRESCYRCAFKDGNNASDLTMGDFWGVKPTTDKDSIFGVSALISNTDKGDTFIQSIRGSLYLDRSDLNDVRNGNPAYVSPAVRPDSRDQFYDLVIEKGLKYAVDQFTHLSLRRKAKIAYLKLQGRIVKYKFLIKNVFKIKPIDFIKYNYFSKNIERDKGFFLVPMHGSLIDIDKTAKIILHANLAINNYPSYRRGNYQARVRLRRGALLEVNDDVNLAYGATLSLDKNAHLVTGRLMTGINDNIICVYKMTFGNRVMFGRNVSIYDSDFHPIYNDDFEHINDNREVIIEDNCWIGANSMVLKGSHIETGAIVSANSMVMGVVESNRVFVNKREAKSIGKNVYWRYP